MLVLLITNPFPQKILRVLKSCHLLKVADLAGCDLLISRQWHGVHGNQMSWPVVVVLLTVISSFGMQIQELAWTVWTLTARYMYELLFVTVVQWNTTVKGGCCSILVIGSCIPMTSANDCQSSIDGIDQGYPSKQHQTADTFSTQIQVILAMCKITFKWRKPENSSLQL